MRKRFDTEFQGDALIIRFINPPPKGILGILSDYGYERHTQPNVWIGRKRQADIVAMLNAWNQQCNYSGPKREDALCWSCDKACGRCNWSRKPHPKPVDGWTAIRHGEGESERYYVIKCPEYYPDKRKRAELAKRGKKK